MSDIYVGDDGKLHKTKGGADSVLNFSSIKKIYYLGDDISKLNIVNAIGVTANISNRCLHLRTTKPHSADRGFYISIDVTDFNYLSIIMHEQALQTNSSNNMLAWIANMEDATPLATSLFDVSHLTGEHILKIFAVSGQGGTASSGSHVHISMIFGF